MFRESFPVRWFFFFSFQKRKEASSDNGKTCNRAQNEYGNTKIHQAMPFCLEKLDIEKEFPGVVRQHKNELVTDYENAI